MIWLVELAGLRKHFARIENFGDAPPERPYIKGSFREQRFLLDTTDDGDDDADGFNETEGCYVLKSAREGMAFTLHGRAIPRMFPAFKIKDWPGAAPETLQLGAEKLAAGKDFNASVREGVLSLQIFRAIKDNVNVTILAP